MERPVRKHIRLRDYDYNTPGYYFITFCTVEREKILCSITDGETPDTPLVQYTKYGNIAKSQIEKMADYYDDIKVEKYVIMPNHMHLLLRIVGYGNCEPQSAELKNSRVSRFVGTFKRFCNREYGRNVWQRGSNDHVIRGEEDYRNIWEYIENNPLKWKLDIFWSE